MPTDKSTTEERAKRAIYVAKLPQRRESSYVMQQDEHTLCPKCGKHVRLLCSRNGNPRHAWFYICFACHFIAQVGKGEVRWAND